MSASRPRSHGGRYYRAHSEAERERKRIESARVASNAKAFIDRHSDLAGRWPLTFDEEAHRWRMSRASEQDFRAFLRERNWSILSHSTRRVTRTTERKRANFAVEGLGMNSEEYEQGPYGGR
jgi:hypothetical protein